MGWAGRRAVDWRKVNFLVLQGIECEICKVVLDRWEDWKIEKILLYVLLVGERRKNNKDIDIWNENERRINPIFLVLPILKNINRRAARTDQVP